MNNQKLETIQERALKILYDDDTSTYDELLEKAGTNTLLPRSVRYIDAWLSYNAATKCGTTTFVLK